MKQLIKIPAIFLKKHDLVFDYERRDLQKVDYVSIEDEAGTNKRTGLMKAPKSVHVCYGEQAMSADNFEPYQEITIQIDNSAIPIVKSENIGYR